MTHIYLPRQKNKGLEQLFDMQLLNQVCLKTKRRRFVWPGEPWLQLEESALSRARRGFFGFQVRER